jgi:hypothetical protein
VDAHGLGDLGRRPFSLVYVEVEEDPTSRRILQRGDGSVDLGEWFITHAGSLSTANADGRAQGENAACHPRRLSANSTAFPPAETASCQRPPNPRRRARRRRAPNRLPYARARGLAAHRRGQRRPSACRSRCERPHGSAQRCRSRRRRSRNRRASSCPAARRRP